MLVGQKDISDTSEWRALGDPLEADAGYSRLAIQLGKDIHAGVYPANARLKVRDLAARYGVSPSPVREALQVLQGQGLIEIDANKGARVRRLDAAGINHVCEMHQALESFAARVLAMSASAHHVQVLGEIDAQHRASYAAEDWRTFNHVGRDFHHAIYRFVRNPFVMRTAIIYGIMFGSRRKEIGYSQQRLSALCDEHSAILDAIRRHESDLAGRLAYEHAKSCTDDLVDRILEQEERATKSVD